MLHTFLIAATVLQINCIKQLRPNVTVAVFILAFSHICFRVLLSLLYLKLRVLSLLTTKEMFLYLIIHLNCPKLLECH